MEDIILNDYAHVQGGADQVAIQSALGLARRGINVTFIYAAGNLDSRLNHSNIKCIDLGQYDLLSNPSKIDAALSGLWNKEVERKIKRILNDYPVKETIIHIHTWVKALSVSALSVILELKFSFVITLHDYFSVCPNGGFYNYNLQKVCTLRPMSTACILSNCDSRNYLYKMWRVLRQLLYKRAEFPDKVLNFISVSNFSYKILEPYLPREVSYWHIPNPIDIEKEDISQPGRSMMFTYIGRLSPEKGVNLLAQITSIPQKQLRIVGAGDSLDYLRKKLPDAQFTGWLPRDEIIKILRDTRALLFTSAWYETQGMVVAEAAAFGVPAIVSDITAAREFIEDKKTGLLYKSGDLRSLENHILNLNDDSALVSELGNNAYDKYWKNPPNLNQHVSKLLKCYSQILKKDL